MPHRSQVRAHEAITRSRCLHLPSATMTRAALAAKLHAYLNSNGARAFCDHIDDPDHTLGDRIYDRIRTAATFLVILTEGVTRSLAQSHSSIHRELSCAVQSGRRIAVVQVGQRSFLPPDLAPALEGEIPRVHILVSPPSAATLRLITSSVVSTPIDLQAEVDGFNAPWPEVAAIMAGVRATAMGEFDRARGLPSRRYAPVSAVSSELLMDRRITGRDLVDACEDVTSAAARALMIRTLVVGLLKHVARPVTTWLVPSRTFARSGRCCDRRSRGPPAYPRASSEVPRASTPCR